MSIKVSIHDQEVTSALQALTDAIGNVKPALKAMGDVLIDSTKQRFQTTTAPDGTPWEANKASTLINYANRFKSSSYSKKTGKITKAGIDRITGKKPGTGETRKLQEQIFSNVTKDGLEVGSPMIYSSTFHNGAKKGQYGNGVPWGDIPSREFLGLSDEDQGDILDIIRQHFLFS
ncbi:phage virion morphogenesis protein [Gynuella sp.]|uniref:phage virion morphogenesis protein n=1 Tax=Gynuella sp. TaxID=2969146 RepID=UPI003D0E834F